MSAPLQLNSSGPDVVALQQTLQAVGFSPGAIAQIDTLLLFAPSSCHYLGLSEKVISYYY